MEPPENGASLDDGEVVSDKAWELLNGDSSPKLKPDGEGGANASATKQADTCGGDSVAVNDDVEMSEALAKDQNSVSDVKLIVNGCDSESGTQDKCSTESVEISSAEVDEPSSNKTGSVDPAKEDPGIARSVSDGGDAALKASVSSEAAETSTVPNGGTCELEDGGAPDLDSNSDKDIVQLPAEETVGASCVDQTSDLLRDSSASSSSAQVDNAGDSSKVGVDADASDVVTQSGVEGDSAGRSNEEAGTLEVEQKGEEKNTEAEETTSTGDIVEQNDTSACDKGTSSAPDADNKMETGDVDNSDQPLVVPLPAETSTSDSNSAADNSSAVDRAGESANSSDKPDLSSEKQSASSDSAGPETVPSKPSNALYPLGKPVTDGVGSVNKPAKPAVKVKATARKSGQPVNKTSIIVNDSGGPGSGTIKIVNYGNSNITLKLSELEDVLKVKDVSKSVIKPDASKSLPKSVAGGDVSRNHQDKDKMDAAHAATVATCTADPTSEGAKFGSPKRKIGRMRFRKKRRGGTYDFPGMKKIPKKKKPFSLPGGNDSLDSKSEDGASDFEPLRKVSHKTIDSPRKCNALDLLTKNSHRAFRKRRNAMLRRKSNSPLKGRSVMDMLRERLAAGGDRTNSGDGVASSQTTPARSSQFVSNR
ncbi:hypothetical protein BaRGS_00004329 [Batillaria attramentaria]|uniref:Uncharacterized protein n=1 Tax=Batillaria attramentaria TaxID=370345 RepID=A0ABD0LZA3_9CAEN